MCVVRNTPFRITRGSGSEKETKEDIAIAKKTTCELNDSIVSKRKIVITLGAISDPWKSYEARRR